MQSNDLVGGSRAGFFARLGRKMCFSRQNVSFRRSLNVLNCFLSVSNSGFLGLSGCGFYLPDY